MRPMNVRIVPGFLFPPESEQVGAFPGLEGGLRVTVDGTTLTGTGDSAYWDESLFKLDGSEHDSSPANFVGEDIGLSIEGIESILDPFVENTAERHHEYTAEMFGEPGSTLLVISRLDEEHVRLAALPRLLDQSAQPELAAQIGFVTTPENIATALADCISECLEYTRRAYVVEDRHADFESAFQELEKDYKQKISKLRSFSATQ